MCFSAEASFGAGAVIGIMGVVAIKKASTTSQRVLAIIPLFFSFQQCMEGILWLSLPNLDELLWHRIGTYGFLVFAWVVWPVFIPFSIRLLEEDRIRRKILTVILGMGGFVSLCFAYVLIFYHAESSIMGHHIQYKQNFEYGKRFSWLTSICYFVSIAISPFTSSNKKFWLLAITILISFIITKLYFQDHFVSIWCFFAAILSILILWIIVHLREVSEKNFA